MHPRTLWARLAALALSALLGLAYGSLVYQGLYFCLLLGLMIAKQQLRDMFWLFLLTGIMACAGALLLPALGPSHFYNIQTDTGFVPVMQHLLSGRGLNFSLSGMTGVVSFPSFHTAMALAYCWAFRKTGIISAAITSLNIIMLCAVPFFGGLRAALQPNETRYAYETKEEYGYF